MVGPATQPVGHRIGAKREEAGNVRLTEKDQRCVAKQCRASPPPLRSRLFERLHSIIPDDDENC